MSNEEKIIMHDSAEAAVFETREVSGWWASNGHCYRDESTARYAGSTHRKCDRDPSHPIYRTNAYCEVCHETNRQAVFDAMPREVWDGETPLVIFDSEDYFFDREQLDDYCNDNDCTPQDLNLVICRANHAHCIESDYWCEKLPEDGDLPPVLADAVDDLNAIILKLPPLSWSQGKIAAIIEHPTSEGDAEVCDG